MLIRMATIRTDPMNYQPGMEIITSDIRDKVLTNVDNYDYSKISVEAVEAALKKDHLSLEDYGALLSPAATPIFRRNGKKSCY